MNLGRPEWLNCLDFIVDNSVVLLEPRSAQKSHAKEENVLTGYAKSRNSLRFFWSCGVGNPGFSDQRGQSRTGILPVTPLRWPVSPKSGASQRQDEATAAFF